MGDRAANASIMGFEYQLLQSLNLILKSYGKSSDDFVEIEGIEDLDVHSTDGVDLYQFKYYESSNSRNATFQKAIAYLFCHWKMHKFDEFTYKLMVHTKGQLSPVDTAELKRILSLTDGLRILNKEFDEFEFNSNELESFLEVFEFKNVPSS